MTAESLISLTFPALKLTDTVQIALDQFAHEKTHWLPVVENKQYLGMISEDMLIDEKSTKKLAAIEFQKQEVFVEDSQHYFEVFKSLFTYQTGSVAVINANKEYLGSVIVADIANYFADIGFINSPGGILVLAVPQRNYSLAEISRIIESNDMKALCVYVSKMMDESYDVSVTIKLDKVDLTRLIASFDRYGYKIIADFHESSFKHLDTDRLELLLKYLSI